MQKLTVAVLVLVFHSPVENDIPFSRPNKRPVSADGPADADTLWALEERREEAGELLRGRGGEEQEEALV